MTEVDRFFARAGVRREPNRQLSQQEVNRLVVQLVFEHCAAKHTQPSKPVFSYGDAVCDGMGV